jgi:cytochrome P450
MAQALQIRDLDDPAYDPFTSDEVLFGDHLDPYPILASWRDRGPVIPGSFREAMGMEKMELPSAPSFMVIGADEANEVLTHAERFSNEVFQATMGVTFGRSSLSVLDGPEHRRWRVIFQKILRPQQVAAWGETILEPVLRELVGRFLPRGRADLIGEFTLRYPFEIIYRQLALPASEVRTFQRLAIAQTDYMHPAYAREASARLGEYFQALIAERRAHPGEDLVSLLALTEAEGDYLPEDVLVCFLRQLMNAGGDTTYRGTSVLLTALLENPDQLEAVRRDRDLIPQAIEEALRWDGPVSVQDRLAMADTELGGVAIPAGAVLEVLTGAVNRDPAVYPDPDRFDIFRPKAPHLAFARGAHMCVGQHLARLEMTRALNALLDRLPNLRFDPDFPRPHLRGATMRVPPRLQVRFDA